MRQNLLQRLREAAEHGNADAASTLSNRLGSMYYNGVEDGLNELEEWFSSYRVRTFALEHKVTPQQERDLLFCAVLMTQNWEPATVLPMLKDKDTAARVLREAWGITSEAGALDVLRYLSIADGHTTEIDSKYKAMGPFASELNRRRPDNNFNTAKQMLIDFGYDNDELMTLPTLAAWDYGRCGFIARFSLCAGYIDEQTAWEFVHRAAENAVQSYDSWRQYIAAYVLGRAIWGSDCADMEDKLAYLLCSSNSPFKRGIEIKQGYQDTNFNFHYDSLRLEPDYAEAAKWYLRAAEHGNQESIEMLDKLRKGSLEQRRALADLGDLEAIYRLGSIYDNGRKDDAAKIEDWLGSDAVREFELKNKATAQQEHDLLFSAVIMTLNWQSSTVLALKKDSKDVADTLHNSWGITNKAEAIETMEQLCTGGSSQIRRIEAEYKAICSGECAPSKDFTETKRMLMDFGYDEKELMTLPTLAAWDYGRCGFIARFSKHVNYIDTKTAWDYIHRAAECAIQHYDSWREYLAAYVLGRALWGRNCRDIEGELAYLLCSPNSPFKYGIEIKQGHKDTNFDFHYVSKNIEPDYEKAVAFYREAADGGNAAAQCSLGYCYDKGQGVPQDMAEAVKWYRKAAEAGDVTAQYNMGNCYRNGRGGLPKDVELAKRWYGKAAAQGDEDAENMLDKLGQGGDSKGNWKITAIIIAVIVLGGVLMSVFNVRF